MMTKKRYTQKKIFWNIQSTLWTAIEFGDFLGANTTLKVFYTNNLEC